MSAGGNADRIALGPGRIWYAPVATANPTSASAALPSAWIALGYTKDGSELEIVTTTEGIDVEEELDPVLYAPTKRETKFRCESAQATVGRLALAIGAGAGYTDTATTFKWPAPGSIVPVKLVWDSDETATTSANRRMLIHKAYPVGTIKISRKKAPDMNTIPMEFLCAYDATEATPITVWSNLNGLI